MTSVLAYKFIRFFYKNLFCATYINTDKNIQKIFSNENIMDIKVRNKKLAKDIQKGILKCHKARSARDKAKTKFSQSLKEGVQTGKAYFDYQKVLRELKKNFRVDASNKISRRLSELGLSNLITKIYLKVT